MSLSPVLVLYPESCGGGAAGVRGNGARCCSLVLTTRVAAWGGCLVGVSADLARVRAAVTLFKSNLKLSYLRVGDRRERRLSSSGCDRGVRSIARSLVA